MKSFNNSVLGVTLLEVMLVLVIISTVIVMSMRYYSNASASSQAESILGTLQAIGAAADSYAVGSTSGYTGFAATNLPTNLSGQWGVIALSGTASATGFSVSFPTVNNSTCLALKNLMATGVSRFTAGTCPVAGTPGALVFTYSSSTSTT